MIGYITLGGVDEGAPGMREGGFYCAYFRDLLTSRLFGRKA